jgi:hypothetical protein
MWPLYIGSNGQIRKSIPFSVKVACVYKIAAGISPLLDWPSVGIILRHVRDFRTYKKQLFLERPGSPTKVDLAPAHPARSRDPPRTLTSRGAGPARFRVN